MDDTNPLPPIAPAPDNLPAETRAAAATQYRAAGYAEDAINAAVFKLLGYVAIFPGGVSKLEDSEGRVLPDCFLMKEGSTALDFAYLLHTDLGKNFIKAIDVRTKRAVGKDYVIKNRDILEIITSK